jgi:hypothetical protein
MVWYYRAWYEGNEALQLAKQEGRLFNDLTWPTTDHEVCISWNFHLAL